MEVESMWPANSKSIHFVRRAANKCPVWSHQFRQSSLIPQRGASLWKRRMGFVLASKCKCNNRELRAFKTERSSNARRTMNLSLFLSFGFLITFEGAASYHVCTVLIFNPLFLLDWFVELGCLWSYVRKSWTFPKGTSLIGIVLPTMTVTICI